MVVNTKQHTACVLFAGKFLFREKPAPELDTKECPYCLSVIPLKASRCAHCIAEIKGA